MSLIDVSKPCIELCLAKVGDIVIHWFKHPAVLVKTETKQHQQHHTWLLCIGQITTSRHTIQTYGMAD